MYFIIKKDFESTFHALLDGVGNRNKYTEGKKKTLQIQFRVHLFI